MFALGGWNWPTPSDFHREATAGVTSWRIPLDYKTVAAVKGQGNLKGYDALVANAAREGIAPMFTLTGCPTWSCPAGGVPTSGDALVAWKAFVGVVVSRYGANGTFWAANPTIPRHPVTFWQVLNEVNGADQWPNPDPAAYAAFLAATAQTIRATDPAAKVVLAGLPEKMTIWMKDYLAALYRQPTFKGSVDVIAVHGYAATPAGVFQILDTARGIMIDNGDAAKPLWITEIGWASAGPAHPFTTTEAGQAGNLRATWDTLLGCRARWNLQRTYWYAAQDMAVPAGVADYWGFHDGLVRADGTAKPALAAFHEFTDGAPLPAGRGDGCSLPGGTTLDTAAPDTTMSSLAPRISDTTPDVAFTSTESGVTFQCHIVGLPWASCPLGADGRWHPAAPLTEGAYTLEARAVDAQGNVDPTPASASFIVDATPPDTYVSGTWGNVTSRTVTLTLSANEAVSGYQCRVDAAAWAPCASPFTTTLPAGNHTISVRAIDVAGLVDPNPAVPWYTVA
jgi:hypothetical protein